MISKDMESKINSHFLSESWVISKDMGSKINSFAMSCYHILLGIKRLDQVSKASDRASANKAAQVPRT